MKRVYQLDAMGYYYGPCDAEESPLEPGVYLIPAHCVETAPPAAYDQAKHRAKWDGDWHLEDIPVKPEPTAEQVRQQVVAERLMAYRHESDPLKNEAEYDALVAGTDPDYTAWLEKVDEIKARYPLPDQ